MIEKIIQKVGDFCSWLSFALVILITLDVFLRYVFNFSSASLYELEWHFFAIIFLLGSSITLQKDEHVRVDVFYSKFSEKKRQIINLLGNVFFLLPFSLVIFYTSLPFVEDSLYILESSPDPGGLPYRFIIKSIIPISFLLLALQGVINILKNLKKYQMDSIPLILFLLVFILILFGYPVALTLGGISILAGLFFFDVDFFYLVSLRIYGIMNNFVLLAVPLFVFMGLTLEKSGIAERLLETMAILFGKIKGGLAYSVVIVGGMLAASTGIVGATVVTMGLISLPTMLKRGYDAKLATGVIASSGTLGQIIPPSVVLVLLGSVLNISVGNLFISALLPGITLVFLYLVYIGIITYFSPSSAPTMPSEMIKEFKEKTSITNIINAFLLPFILIFAVLGSIFLGIASPTEAAGIGAAGALLLSLIQGSINLKKINDISSETTKLTSIVFMILLGATSFSLVFRGLEGDKIIVDMITSSNLTPEMFLIYILIVVFIAGFFIDFIEIIFIIVPVITPILIALDIDLIWVGIMLAINLQTSFLTPPFGFSLFYLKSVSPKEIRTTDIYKGVIPFVIIQLLFLIYLFFNPQFIYLIPEFLENYNS